ncbi:hypothetical protein [Staphylococcus pseudintermedius]|uniref:hypothetical protein n=1 Tax=Staphylococcus pseudintermedius TaxID=283734 RepID=UPI000D725AF1|nr:hypothetical protein [Staphylococcus pseudintermedius]EGQ3451696.1 hypothetical protein [Staphylococcus pseudintermedius]EJY3775653.1 hypothetical protein [Staphylococcus pseudintermedius]ELK4039643.1 hypothetical protein [Staphylococcus pseudintermedius]PXA17327.1 hypothetical protein DD899_08390 [Staphylococcus pseudintermedius]HCA7520378.1 hypothetical protein [Staphylococcus pseudintermedius]
MPDSEETYYVVEISCDILGRGNKRIYNSYPKKEVAEDVANRINNSCINWGDTYFVVMTAKNYLKFKEDYGSAI